MVKNIFVSGEDEQENLGEIFLKFQIILHERQRYLAFNNNIQDSFCNEKRLWYKRLLPYSLKSSVNLDNNDESFIMTETIANIQ